MEKTFGTYWSLQEYKRGINGAVNRKFLKFRPLTDVGSGSEAHRLWLRHVLSSKKVLDFGAGDMRFRDFAMRNGFSGEYRTLDVGVDRAYDFRSLDDIEEKFDLILCFEVIEHMPLEAFVATLGKFADLLEPGGRLVITTPNIHHINHFWKTDVTHIRPYPYEDLYALLRRAGFSDLEMYRIVWWTDERIFFPMIFLVRRILTYFLGVDYATNIAFVGKR